MLWYILAFIIPLFLVFLQTVMQSLITINGVYPEFLLIGLLYYGNSRSQLYGQFIGLFAGLAIDFLSTAPLGFFAFIYTLIGFIAGSTTEKVYSDSILTPVFMTAIALIIKEIMAFILSAIFRQVELQSPIFGSDFFFHALYTLLLAPLIFALLRFIDKAIPQRQRKGYKK